MLQTQNAIHRVGTFSPDKPRFSQRKKRGENGRTFYGRTVSANKLCIVMEYVHYGSLGAMLVKPDPILLKFKVRVALDVAKGFVL